MIQAKPKKIEIENPVYHFNNFYAYYFILIKYYCEIIIKNLSTYIFQLYIFKKLLINKFDVKLLKRDIKCN